MTSAEPAELAVAPDRPRRLVYLGTPEVAVAPLRALHAAGFDMPLVVTRPDKRRGRGSGLAPSPVKAAATELGLPVSHDLADVTGVGADLGVVVAYGRIIPRAVLEQLAMVNIHFSLLPRWRGAAPVERALLAGDDQTGVCLMEVAEGLDTGGVYASAATPITADDTLTSLRERLVAMGTELLVSRLTEGLGTSRPQEGEPTHAAKIEADEYRIDWARPTDQLHRLVRLGGAWTTFRDRRLKVWSADPAGEEQPSAGAVSRAGAVLDTSTAGVVVGTGDGALELLEVQPEGKARQSALEWRNGARPAPGEVLGP